MFMTVLLATSLAAPVPKDKPAGVYYLPVVVGTKRVIETTRGKVVTETEEEVTKAEEKDGVYTVVITVTLVVGPGGTPVPGFPAPFEVTATKVVSTLGKEPQTAFDLGVKAGESWKVETGTGDAKVTVTYTMGKEEEVEVPAGKFKAVPVTVQRGGGSKTTKWYAAGVGVVKQATDPATPANFAGDFVLKSFTPAKDAKK